LKFSLPDLSERYRKSTTSFTRNRKLPFLTVSFLILQKSAKSLTNRLNEYFGHLTLEAASASAFTQARRNLNHQIFIDFNRDSYVEAYYEEDDYQQYKGHRLLAIDASRLRLPETKEARAEFGASRIRLANSSSDSAFTGAYCSVLYDVLNEIVLTSELAHVRSSERYLANQHLSCCSEKDLLLMDRGYTSYELFSSILERKADFVCRCASNSFMVVQDFIAETNITEKIVALKPWKKLTPQVRRGELPREIKIRLLKIQLSSGETEILATSLLNKKKYPAQEFFNLYALRWGVETYFDRLKNRLTLENFTGKTVEAIKQDFYSTILVSNIESELAYDVDRELESKINVKYKQKVNNC